MINGRVTPKLGRKSCGLHSGIYSNIHHSYVQMQAKRHTQSDLKEDGKGYIDRDFSQHGSNVVQRIISSQTAINSQRHSLQVVIVLVAGYHYLSLLFIAHSF